MVLILLRFLSSAIMFVSYMASVSEFLHLLGHIELVPISHNVKFKE